MALYSGPESRRPHYRCKVYGESEDTAQARACQVLPEQSTAREVENTNEMTSISYT